MILMMIFVELIRNESAIQKEGKASDCRLVRSAIEAKESTNGRYESEVDLYPNGQSDAFVS